MVELGIYNKKVGADFTKLMKQNGMIINGNNIIHIDLEAVK